jgi:hypothetical protein
MQWNVGLRNFDKNFKEKITSWMILHFYVMFDFCFITWVVVKSPNNNQWDFFSLLTITNEQKYLNDRMMNIHS